MIKGKQLSENLFRLRQEYDTRLDKIRLGQNERPQAMPPELFREIISGYTIEEASAYPELKLVYDALSEYIGQPSGRIMLTSGADTAIKMVLESFCEKGNVILTCSPTYLMYRVYAKMVDCKLNKVLPDNLGNFDLKQLIDQGKHGARVIMIANPNGRTGFYFSMDELRLLLSEFPETPVIIDEVYADFANLNAAPLLEEFDNLIILRSFSKNVGFAGLQVGYILAKEPVIEIIEKFKPAREINSLAARSVKVLCSKPGLIEKLADETIRVRGDFANSLKELGFEVIEKGGNFVLVNFGNKNKIIKASLINNNVEFKSLDQPLDDYIRLAIANTEIMNAVLRIISEAADSKPEEPLTD